MKKLTIILILLIFNFSAQAKVNVELSVKKVTVGELFYLIISEKSNSGVFNFGSDVDLSPLKKDFDVVSSNKSVNTVSSNNQSMTTNKTTIGLIAKKEGIIIIPSLTSNSYSTPELVIEVTSASDTIDYDINGQEQSIFIKAAVDEANPYEMAQVIYTLRAYIPVSIGVLDGKFGKLLSDDALIESIDSVKKYESKINNVRYLVFEGKYVVFPTNPGKVEIDSEGVSFIIEEPSKQRSSNSFFMPFDPFAKQKEIYLKQDKITLDVKPKPSYFADKIWLPAINLTGEFDFPDNSVSHKTGEPIDINIILKAEGLLAEQLPDLKLPEVEGLKVYQGKEDKNDFFKKNTNSFKSISYAIIPSSAGDYTIPSFDIPWYDTLTNNIKNVKIPEIKIKSFDAINKTIDNPINPRLENTIKKDDKSASILPIEESSYNQGLLLFIGVCTGIGISALLFFIYIAKIKNKEKRTEKSSNKDLKQIKNACEISNPKLIQGALLDWARENIDSKINNITKIADYFKSQELKEQFEKLNQSIYSNNKLDFDSMEIYKTLQKEASLQKGNLSKAKNKIPNLYPF